MSGLGQKAPSALRLEKVKNLENLRDYSMGESGKEIPRGVHRDRRRPSERRKKRMNWTGNHGTFERR
jgi:hypothetical protein